MRASFSEILAERRGAHAAVGAFTCYDVTTAIGVVTAAERRSVPVILLVSQASAAAAAGRLLLPALSAVAEAAAIPVCVQLDHATDLNAIERALDCRGLGAVLADGSRLPLDEHLRFVDAVRELTSGRGVELEVELGHVAGGEDVAEATQAGRLTDPAQAERFVGQTGASCLAVSIGNVHGTYADPPSLNWDLLDEIRRCVAVALALHGASGLPVADVRRAVAAGITKVNVNTEIREQTLEAIADTIKRVRSGAKVLELDRAVADAVSTVVETKLELFAPCSARD